MLRAKDPGAAARSPISISFTAEVPRDSAEAHDLQQAGAFGPIKPFVLTGDMVKDFRITGPRLVAHEDDGSIERLEWHPTFVPDSWQQAEILLCDAEGQQLGSYLAEVRLAGEGQLGFTLQVRVSRQLELTFRCPNDPGTAGSADWRTQDIDGLPVGEVFETADFVVQFADAATLEIWMGEGRIAKMDIAGRMSDSDFVDSFTAVRDLADDLKIIEADTRVRFRFPSELSVFERIMIRNLRLMLEGHCVAHPTDNRLSLTLTGVQSDALDQVLSTDYGWLMQSAATDLVILGRRIRLPALNLMALARLGEDSDIDELKAALAAGTARRRLTFELRPGDRVRMYLPDRVPADYRLDITPWNLTGVEQAGLGPDGEPLRCPDFAAGAGVR